jgi:hypothetical protein
MNKGGVVVQAEPKWHRKGGRDVADFDGKTVIVRSSSAGFEVVLKEPGEAGFTYKVLGRRASRESARRSGVRILLGQTVSDWNGA